MLIQLKSLYYIIFFSDLLFIGCSTYTIKNYQSKEKFYQDFNNSVKNRDVNITSVSKGSFNINDGIVLENDSLISYRKSERKEKISIGVSDLKDIIYTGNDSKSASLVFKNGEILKCENMISSRDSISLTAMKTLTLRNAIIPIDKVKSVSYPNRLRSLPSGLFVGAVVGLITATIISKTSNDNESQSISYYVSAPIIGALFGVAIASIIGWNTTYQFNL